LSVNSIPLQRKVLQGFAEACRYINRTICPSLTNKNRIQKEVYRAVRQQFGLTANLAVRACARVAANRKVGRVKAKATNSAIALEDLTGIRERIHRQPRSKTERRRSNRWAFYQLRQFLEYKAIRAGVRVWVVPAAYTSQTCHKCLHIHPDPAQSDRDGKQFRCGHCGWEGDADFNGANVIALFGVACKPAWRFGLVLFSCRT